MCIRDRIDIWQSMYHYHLACLNIDVQAMLHYTELAKEVNTERNNCYEQFISQSRFETASSSSLPENVNDLVEKARQAVLEQQERLSSASVELESRLTKVECPVGHLPQAMRRHVDSIGETPEPEPKVLRVSGPTEEGGASSSRGRRVGSTNEIVASSSHTGGDSMEVDAKSELVDPGA